MVFKHHDCGLQPSFLDGGSEALQQRKCLVLKEFLAPMSGMTKREDGHALPIALLQQKRFQWMWRQSLFAKTHF